jgi:hypothetical protein
MVDAMHPFGPFGSGCDAKDSEKREQSQEYQVTVHWIVMEGKK